MSFSQRHSKTSKNLHFQLKNTCKAPKTCQHTCKEKISKIHARTKISKKYQNSGNFENYKKNRNFVRGVYFAFFEYIAPPQHTKRCLKLNSTRNFGRKRMHTRLLRLLVPKKSKKISNIWHRDKFLWHGRLSLANRQMSVQGVSPQIAANPE